MTTPTALEYVAKLATLVDEPGFIRYIPQATVDAAATVVEATISLLHPVSVEAVRAMALGAQLESSLAGKDLVSQILGGSESMPDVRTGLVLSMLAKRVLSGDVPLGEATLDMDVD